MKLSWTSFKISIAGAKLSHLAQKDRIWDHGSMIEQAKSTFYKVQKALKNGDVESLRKNLTSFCYETFLQSWRLNNRTLESRSMNTIIKELVIIEVKPGKNNRPDKFIALIKGYTGQVNDHPVKFAEEWAFVRQGDWWVLNEIR